MAEVTILAPGGTGGGTGDMLRVVYDKNLDGITDVSNFNVAGTYDFDFNDFPGALELFTVPAGVNSAGILAIQVNVTTAFVGGASFTIGIDGSEGKYFSMPGEDILGALGVVQIDQSYPLVAGEVVKIYLSSAPSAGAFTLIL